MTNYTFITKHTNFINVITYVIFFGVVFLKFTHKSKSIKEFVSTVTGIAKSTKYKINYLNVKFKEDDIVLAYPNSFFDVEEYLSVEIGDSLTYHLLNDKISKVKNLKNNNELDELYFVIQETNGFQISIIFFLMIFNSLQMVKLDAFSGLINRDETHLNQKAFFQKLNDFTKKISL